MRKEMLSGHNAMSQCGKIAAATTFRLQQLLAPSTRLHSAAFFAATPCLGGCLSHGAFYHFCLFYKAVVRPSRV